MEEILLAFQEIQTDLPWQDLLVAGLFLVTGQVILKLIDQVFYIIVRNKKDKVKALSFRKFFIYLYNLILLLLFLKLIHVDMKVVLGASAFLTLAIGFAARTPISNLISGFFLLFEKPFVVGNIIEVNGFRGEVVSRNLLSLTMRTLDNVMVRIPNELVIGSSVSNTSYFPIRRLDITYLISNKESITQTENIFMDVAGRNSLALNEPAPYFYVSEFKENCIEVEFRVWTSSEDFLTFKSEFPKEIHRAVKKAGLEPIRDRIEILNTLKVDRETSKQ